MIFVGDFVSFLLTHIFRLTFDIITNSEKPKEFILPTDFGVDPEKYYYLIVLHSYLCCYILSITVLQGDALLLMFLEHASGIFGTIG